MSDKNVVNETPQQDFGKITTAGTEVETSGQGFTANKATARHLALPSLPVANLDLGKVVVAILWKRYSKWQRSYGDS